MLKCPQCGSDKLKKDGVTHDKGSVTGKQRYACLNESCKSEGGNAWRGSAPIGLEAELKKGIDKRLVAELHKRIVKGKRFVITSAQNATPVHKAFFISLLNYCRVNRAELIVIPYRYKNPTSIFSDKQEADDWWATEVTGFDRDLNKRVGPNYLYNRRRDLDAHIMILGDIMTQPTATRPLGGYETISGKKSAIIGHPKLELLVVPTPQSRLPKILTTTGSVTMRNYGQGKAGSKGKFHHTFGAAVVELEGKRFHLRQLNALDDGSFMDLDSEYKPDNIERDIPLEGLNMGDTHEEFISRDVVHGTFGKGGIVPTLKPKVQIFHDLHDFYRRNHHHRGNPFTQVAKHKAGMEDVREGLQQTFSFLDTHTPAGVKSIIVKSNHPDALARWLKEADWKNDPINAEFYLETALEMVRASHMTDAGASTLDPFKMWGERMLKNAERVRFLGSDESYMVKGIECTYHGHYGANGSRGSIKSFGKIGVKTIIGHGHSPGICDGAFQNGTSTPLKLEYTNGPSSWMNTHTIIYRNGKRSLINIIDGHWRG